MTAKGKKRRAKAAERMSPAKISHGPSRFSRWWASDWRAAATIFGLALLVRGVYFWHLTHNSPVANILIHDSALFNHFAHQILSGKFVLDRAFYLSPLYSYFLAFVYWIFGDSFNTARTVQFFLGATGAVLVFVIGKRFFTCRAAVIAGLYAAVYAPFLFFEGSLLGTSLALFLFLCSFWLALTSVQPGRTWLALLSGLCFGLATTGRPNLLTVVPAFLAAPWLLGRRDARRFTVPALWLTAFLLPIFATGLHNRLAEGQWIPLTTHGGINFYIGNHSGASGVWEAPEGMEASVSAINLEDAQRVAEQKVGHPLSASGVSWFWYRKAFDFILSQPLEWLALMVRKAVLFFHPYELPLNFEYAFHQQFSWLLKIPLTNFMFLMPFALFGMVLAWPQRQRFAFLYAVTLLYVVGVVLFFVSGRYRLLVVPYFILFAAHFVDVLLSGEVQQRGRRWLVGGFVAVLALSVWIGYRRQGEANPGNEYYNLCVAHLNEGHVDEAIFWGRKAVLADPSIENAHYNLAVAFLKKGYLSEAIEAFQNVVRLDPSEAAAWGNIGGIYLKLGETNRAIEYLQKAIEADSQYVNAWLNLGIAYYRIGDLGLARRAWERVLHVDPENQMARRNLEVLGSVER